MSEIKNKADYLHETDVLILGGGAAGCGAALAAREAGLSCLIVDKGKLESCGCTGGGNDHFLGVMNSGEPHDTVEDLVKFYDKPASGLAPETVAQWGEAIPRMIEFLDKAGVEFKRRSDGGYARSQGFGQPGSWFMLIRNGQFIKPYMARKIRESGAEVLDHVMITRLVVKDGRMAGAMGYNVLDGSFHVIVCKAAILALGPRATRANTNSARNPFNTQFPPHNTGAHYVLSYEAGARLVCLDTKQSATLLPKSFGCPGMNGITGSGAHALDFKGERYMYKYHPMAEMAPRHLLVQGSFKEQLLGNGPPFYMDMRHLDEETRKELEEELMPGDKATWFEYAAQKGVDFASKPMEVEVGDIYIEALVARDANFESTLPGLFVGTGFHGFSGALCGGYSAGRHAAERAKTSPQPPRFDEAETLAEKKRILKPLKSGGDTHHSLFEQAVRQVMDYYMGYVRNERGMRQALESLERISALEDDLCANNWHELMRTHEALVLIRLCRLVTLACLERRESSPNAVYMRTDYPEPDPALNRILAVERRGGEPHLHWL